MRFLKHLAGAAAIGAAIVLGAGLFAAPAQAAYAVDLTQQGSNVVATGGGTLDLAGLSNVCFGCGASTAEIIPNAGVLVTGPTSEITVDLYTGFTGPASFGSGDLTFASSGSGNGVGIDDIDAQLLVPAGYASDSPLSDISTYDDATFASLGVIPGTYVWTWGPVAADDTFTLDIVTPAVPEPSGLLLLALPLGLAMLLAARHHGAKPTSA